MEQLREDLFNAAMRICTALPWIQKERFHSGLYNLLHECKCNDQLWLIESLLNQFHVVRSGELDDHFHRMADHIVRDWDLCPNDTIISAIAEGGATDGSQTIVKGLETALPRIWNGAITNSIRPVFKLEKRRVVLVDDFVGTGGKIGKKISNIKRHSDSKSTAVEIYVVIVAGMNEGLNRLRKEIGDNNVFSCLELSRGISETIPGTEIRRAIDAMLELEGEFLPPAPFPKPVDYVSCHFGYGGSESLFWIEGFNIPNNVFPVFWWDNYYVREYFEPRKMGAKAPQLIEKRPRNSLFERR